MTVAVPVTVLVPVNHLDRAKGRLSGILNPEQRSRLALTTLATVLEAVRDAGMAATVLTPDDVVGAHVPTPHTALAETGSVSGLNAQLTHAIDRLGASEVLILHGDLPLVSGEALRSFVTGAPAAPSVTIVESGDGGTNAMLLRPALVIALQYGPGSAAFHRAGAASTGATLATFESPGLALDLDTPIDIETLLATETGRTSAAGRLLRSWGFVAAEPGA